MATAKSSSDIGIESEYDQLCVEEFRKRMNAVSRAKRKLHAGRTAGLQHPRSVGANLVVPCHDPIEELHRKFNALTAYLLKTIPVTAEVPSSDQVVAQSAETDDSNSPPAWITEHLTKGNARLVRALWGQRPLSQKELWLRVWHRGDKVVRETIESAVKRTNTQLASLPAEITSTYHIEWRQKQLCLVEVDDSGFTIEPNEPQMNGG